MDAIVALARALSDSSRLRVLMVLAEVPDLCACHLVDMLGVTPATVSRHMGVLRQAGLVDARKCGKWMHYSLCSGVPQADALLAWMKIHVPEEGVILRDREFVRNQIPKSSGYTGASCCGGLS